MIPEKTQERQVIPLSFQSRAVRTVLIGGAPWFVAKDVCDILGLGNTTETLRNFPVDEKGFNTTDTPGGKQEMVIVNEPGLYRLIFQSRKPEAERFKSWVFNTVLPQIRQTGAFIPLSLPQDERLLPFAIARYFEPLRDQKRLTLELGKYLMLLKGTKPHGEFLPCLAAMGINKRNAERYMELCRKQTERELLKKKGLAEQPIKMPPIGFSPTFAAGRQLLLFHSITNRFNELHLNAR